MLGHFVLAVICSSIATSVAFVVQSILLADFKKTVNLNMSFQILDQTSSF